MSKEKSIKVLRDEKRNEFLNVLTELFKDEDVLRIASNAIAIPFVHSNGMEDFYKVVVSIPIGSKDDPFDGYAEAESYALKCEEKKAKAEAKAKENK